jgi:hypothetical protein
LLIAFTLRTKRQVSGTIFMHTKLDIVISMYKVYGRFYSLFFFFSFFVAGSSTSSSIKRSFFCFLGLVSLSSSNINDFLSSDFRFDFLIFFSSVLSAWDSVVVLPLSSSVCDEGRTTEWPND